MTASLRRRAIINGLYVIFESKNTAAGKYHGRFKQRYRTKADALAARDAWEQRGRIMFPEDIATVKPQKRPPRSHRTRQAELFQEARA